MPLAVSRLVRVALALAVLLTACRDSASPRAAAASATRAAAGRPSAGPEWPIVFDRETDGVPVLFVVSSNGGPERRLTEGSLGRFTPDGRRIVFTSMRSGRPQLWEIAVAGGVPRRLRSNEATEYQHDVSPDGRRLAFLSNLDGPERLLLQDLGTGVVRELVRHGEHSIFGNPHWSPDGRSIVFSSNHRIGHQIYVVDVASGEQRRISPLHQGGCEPRFSRDGRRVAYVSRGHLKPTSRLVEQDLATGEEKTLVEWPALNYDPVYSPDGSEIAFASNVTGEFSLYRQRFSDGKAWRVTFAAAETRNPDYGPAR